MAANDKPTTTGNQNWTQETVSPSTSATSSINAPRPSSFFGIPTRDDVSRSADTFATETPDGARPSGNLTSRTKDVPSPTSTLPREAPTPDGARPSGILGLSQEYVAGTSATPTSDPARSLSNLASSTHNVPRSFSNFATLTTTQDDAKPSGFLGSTTEDDAWYDAMYTGNFERSSKQSKLGSNSGKNKWVSEILAVEKEEGAVGGIADGEAKNEAIDTVDGINKATDTVDGAFGLQEGKKKVPICWEHVKTFTSVETCIFMFDEDTVHKAFIKNVLGDITENTSANEIAVKIVNYQESSPGTSAIHYALIHDHGHAADGFQHVVEVEYKHACKKCVNNGGEPILKLKT